MLENLSEPVRWCYERAAEAKQLAEETSDPRAKADFLTTERRLLLMARGFEFSESLTDFIRAIPDRSNVARTLGDVIKRPRNQQPLRRWEEDLQTVINDTPFMLTRCSSDLRYQFVSTAYAQMIGLEPQHVTGKSIIEIMGEEGFNAVLPYIQRVLQGNRVEYESEIHFQGIGPRFLRVVYTPDHDQKGNVQGWIASIINVSDGAHATRVRQQLASIVESSVDAIVSEDLSGVIVSWNKSAQRIFGYSADEVVGKPITILMPPDVEDEESKILEHVGRGEHIELYETKRCHKDGRLLNISLTVSPVKDTDGRIVGASKIVRDITCQKKAQDRMEADLRAMTMLREVGSLCARDGRNLDKCLHEILDVAIAIAGADKGNIQLLEPEARVLTIAAHRGFGPTFLKYFQSVRDDPSACSAAMQLGQRIIVEDVTTSPIFVGQPSMNVLIDAGVRAVISTPLISSAGNLLGMISTHYCRPHRSNERELGLVDLLARQAADYLERKHAEEVQQILVRELEHRSNNLLAIIQVIAHQTLSADRSLAEAQKIFDARLKALACANRRLTRLNGGRVDLREIVHSALAPFGDRTMIGGIGVMISHSNVQNFSLSLHELATNAAKYGALSNETGRVEISWTIAGDGKDNVLKFKWKETGGPPAVPPTRHGFGTSLLKAAFVHVRIDYLVEGLTCEIDVLLDHAEPGAQDKQLQL
jgi:PAS domain S-box-containing protein